MRFSSTFFLFAFFTFGCNSEPNTKEEVMEKYLVAMAECDIETINTLSVKKFEYECSPYDTEVLKINCKTEGKWTYCCCEEEVKGLPEFNGRIYTKYLMEEIEGNWKVSDIYKISDLGRNNINICE